MRRDDASLACHTPPFLQRVELGVRVIDDFNFFTIAFSADLKSITVRSEAAVVHTFRPSFPQALISCSLYTVARAWRSARRDMVVVDDEIMMLMQC